MSKTVSLGYTDTAIGGVSSLDLPRGLLNFGADWAVVSNGNSKELTIVNKTGLLGVPPEKLRYSISDVANIFNGTPVEPTSFVTNKKGKSLLAQISEVWTVTDTEDTTYHVDLPVSAHIVLKVPMSEFVTAARLEVLIGRLVSGLYETGLETTTRFDSLIRGSLAPSDL